MPTTRDWQRNGRCCSAFSNGRPVRASRSGTNESANGLFADARGLRSWLTKQAVTGYAQSLLVMERFGLSDFVTATAEHLVDAQYAKHPHLRPTYDAVINAATRCGEVVIQARKTYVSLVSPRRTFGRVQPTSKKGVILGLRLDGRRPRATPAVNDSRDDRSPDRAHSGRRH